MEELKGAAMSPKGGIKKLSSTIGTGNLEDDDMPDATTRLIRTLSLNYEEEVSGEGGGGSGRAKRAEGTNITFNKT